MDFINWWFVSHWMWATFLTPGCSFLYALFTDQVGWAWGCGAWWTVCAGLRAYDNKKG